MILGGDRQFRNDVPFRVTRCDAECKVVRRSEAKTARICKQEPAQNFCDNVRLRSCGSVLVHSRITTLIGAALLCGLFAAGCGTSRLPRARVMNASPDSPRLDVIAATGEFASRNTIGRRVAFRAVSDYHRVDDGFNDVLVFASDSNDLLLEGTPFFGRRLDYTLIVLDFVQFLNAVLLTDDNSAPSANEFKLRFVNTSPTSGAVDLYVTGPAADLSSVAPSFSDVDLGGFAGYLTRPQGDLRLRVTATGKKNILADTGALTFQAGQITTAVLVNPPGTGTEPLEIVLLHDSP
jgi:hypothetical protein